MTAELIGSMQMQVRQTYQRMCLSCQRCTACQEGSASLEACTKGVPSQICTASWVWKHPALAPPHQDAALCAAPAQSG